MRDFRRAIGFALLGLLTLAVLVGSVVVVIQYPRPPTSTVSVLSESTSASQLPSGTPVPKPTPAALRAVVAGPDLVVLRDRLAGATSAEVQVAEHSAPAVLASGALDTVKGTPDVVVLQVLAGSTTTVRTRTAVDAVRAKWPAVRILVIGPFSSADRLSAAAVGVAAAAARVTFLDPVALGWRDDATATALDEDDRRAVAARLAAVLAS